MDIESYLKKLTSKELLILQALSSSKELSLEELVSKTSLSESACYRLLKSLEAKGLVAVNESEKSIIALSELGSNLVEKKLPELRLLNILKEKKTLPFNELSSFLDEDEISIAIGELKKNKAISMKKENDTLIISLLPNFNEDNLLSLQKFLESLPLDLEKLKDQDLLKKARKRSLVEIKKVKDVSAKAKPVVNKILDYYEKNKDKIVLELTPEIIASQDFDNKLWIEVNPELDVEPLYGGRRHVVQDIINYIREIWLELGFKEMVGNYIDVSFWNFDALFVPQDHPAREMQDTFFLPSKYKLDSKLLPSGDVIKAVKQAHQNGFVKGSKGWQYKWSVEEAMKLVLRTHTTVLSARYLHTLKDKELPAKYFAIGKVFRNETMDWKHLFEIIQVEGIVASENANFRQLLHYIKLFYKKMGFTDVRIRPAYFPYTEPSAEIEVKHPVTGKWLELGGCGIFRPEVTAPLFGKTIKVLAWGLGLDRLAFTTYNLKDIRDLYKNDLAFLRKAKLWI